MEKLEGEKLHLACKVVYERYQRCVGETMTKDVLGNLDLGAANRKCGALFADLSDFCAEYIRSGELPLQKAKK